MRIGSLVLALIAAAGLALPAVAAEPAVDAPELAAPGPYPVGMRTLRLEEPAGPDAFAYARASGAAPLRAKSLQIDIWYPAAAAHGRRAVYRGGFPAEQPGLSVAFSTRGSALDAPPPRRGERYPLVVMSHGYSGTPVAMAWLAENLASKGYVVAGPHHEDPPITATTVFGAVAYQRPVDLAFAVEALKHRAAGGDRLLSALVDPERVAVIGYSMGGYGALTVAGARLSRPFAASTPGALLSRYAAGGAEPDGLRVAGLRAVVAISPFGGTAGAWGPDGMAALQTPALFIVGDHDRTVGYSPGVRSLFDQAVNAPRWLLVFREAGHALGMGEAPPEMRGRLWDLDWFEDPVWRKARITAISAHMITAFLDYEVKGRAASAAYLDLAPRSDEGPLPARRGNYDEVSAGGDSPTWKGFHRGHAAGLEMWRARPAAP